MSRIDDLIAELAQAIRDEERTKSGTERMAMTTTEREALLRFRGVLNWTILGGELTDQELDEYGIVGEEARRALLAESEALKALAESTARPHVIQRASEVAASLAVQYRDQIGPPQSEPLEFDDDGNIVVPDDTPDGVRETLKNVPRLNR